ncbi:MAG: Ribosome-recycling factor [Parcubacteria group bacterium GW2011_GWA2_39_18]|nr:MAG: Ribosome-recycling factor [Parcubacteria group bacterium GW2011_GWA2_39_18]
MSEELLKNLKTELDKVINFVKNEFNALRANRATPALVEDISVEQYGQIQPLKYVATISVVLPNIILIKPWDKQAIEAITKAISHSALSLAPIVEKDSVRLILPTLTQERKDQLIKMLHKKEEDGRIAVRLHRDEAWKNIQKMEKDKNINEDEKFRLKDRIQKLVDEANGSLENLLKQKEKEIEES